MERWKLKWHLDDVDLLGRNDSQGVDELFHVEDDHDHEIKFVALE